MLLMSVEAILLVLISVWLVSHVGPTSMEGHLFVDKFTKATC